MSITFPASSAQKRFFLDAFLRDDVSYRIPLAFSLQSMPRHVLQEAVSMLIEIHSVLRTELVLTGDDVQQKILEEFSFQVDDFVGDPIEYGNTHNFGSSGVNVHCAVDEKSQTVVFIFHHHAVDGFALDIFFAELAKIIAGEVLDEPWQYVDWSEMEREWIATDDFQQRLAEWQVYLQDCPGITPLPCDRAETSKIVPGSCQLEFEVEGLHRYMQKSRLLPSAFAKCILALVLYRLSCNAATDFCLGFIYSNRYRAELEQMMGCLINTLPQRFIIDEGVSALDFFSRQENVLDWRVGFDEILKACKTQRHAYKHPLFQAMITGQGHFDEGDITLGQYTLKAISDSNSQVKFDIDIDCSISGDQVNLSTGFNKTTFDRSSIEKFNQRLRLLMQAVLAERSRVDQLPITLPEELALYSQINHTFAVCTSPRSLGEIFSQKIGEKTAVVHSEFKLTYKELEYRIGGLIKHLDLRPGDVVAVSMQRNIEWLVAISAVMLSGATYCAMSSDDPADRQNKILTNVGAKFLISDRHISSCVVPVVVPGKFCAEFNPPPLDPERVCYLITTSGSTGEPKTIAIRESSLLNLFWGVQGTHLAFTEDDVQLQMSKATFDAHIHEILFPLLAGGTVVILTQLEPRNFWATITANRITRLEPVPALLDVLLEGFDTRFDASSLRSITFGGDVLTRNLIDKLRKALPFVKIFNLYGPAECTIEATYFEIEPDSEIICIGKPLPNYQVFVLDNSLESVAVGCPGELYIGGAGVMKGYVGEGSEELNRKALIHHPQYGGPLYKTGDMVKWLPDGNLMFVGRVDFQVKIRGQRLEIGEIESAIRKHPQVKDVLVVKREDAKDQAYLAAYVVNSDSSLQNNIISDCRQLCKKSLASYMIPTAWVLLDKFPLSANGKIDRKQLPIPHIQSCEAVMPRTLTEEKIWNLWHQILKRDDFGVHEDFYELGGNSLSAMSLMAKFNTEFKQNISVRSTFTIETMSQEVTTKSFVWPKEPSTMITRSQTRMLAESMTDKYFFEKYCITQNFRIYGKLDIEKLRLAYMWCLAHHEALRTFIGSDHKQVVVSLENISGGFNPCFQKFTIEAQEDLNPPHFQMTVVDEGDDTQLLTFFYNHFAVDGKSIDILQETLLHAYRQSENISIPLYTYGQFSAFEEEQLSANAFEENIEFWKALLGNNIDWKPATVHSDRDNGLHQYAQTIAVRLSDARPQAKRYRTTTFGLGLATLFLLCQKLYGSQNTIIGITTEGRYREEMKNIVGNFFQVAPVACSSATTTSIADFCKDMAKSLSTTIINSCVPFDLVQQRTGIAISKFTDTVAGFAFAGSSTVLGFNAEEIDLEGNMRIARNITFDIEEDETGLTFQTSFRTELFDVDTIATFHARLAHLWSVVVSSPETHVGSINCCLPHEIGLFNSVNCTHADVPNLEKTVGQLVYNNCKKFSTKTAVILDDQCVDYKTLLEHACAVSQKLRTAGITQGDVVIQCVERSLEMVVGMVAIQLIGAVYCPFHPDDPIERGKQIAVDVGAKLVLTTSEHTQSWDIPVVFITMTERSCDDYQEQLNLNACYMITTSGSTGKPKTLTISHKSLINYTLSMTSEPHNWGCEDSVLQTARCSFDVHIMDIYCTLLFGGTIVMLRPRGNVDANYCLDVIRKQTVTRVPFVPSLVNNFIAFCDENPQRVKDLSTVKSFALSGESLTGKTTNWLLKNTTAAIVNFYGPAECTVNATCFFVKENFSGSIPIGKPLLNYQCYVLDANMNRVPIDHPGELYIGGAGVMIGYTDNKGASIVDHATFGRLYKTGDIVKFLSSGDLQFLGRVDLQVKIRGQRLEIAEIESAILSHKKISNCCVTKSSDGSQLVAFLERAKEIKIAQSNHPSFGSMFVAAAEKHPNKLAIVYDNESVTYKSLLNSAINLMKKFPTSASKVALVLLDHGHDLSIAFVATQLAGWTYCPVHPDDPQERIKDISTNTKASCIITDNDRRFSYLDLPIITTAKESCEDEHIQLTDAEISYMISTSGTTGKPKTIAIFSHSLAHVCRVMIDEKYYEPDDKILQMSRCTFDVHIIEIAGAFSAGATLVCFDRKKFFDARYIIDTVAKHQVTCIPIVPSVAETILAACESQNLPEQLISVQKWHFAGEALHANTIEKIRNLGSFTFRNFYGPAETTIYSSCFTIKEQTTGSIPIGKPLPGYTFSISEGELVIGGKGVMRGYVNNGKLEGDYYTGDLVLVDSNGDYKYVGRNDTQVKIRGQRLELSAVEDAIYHNKSLEKVVVVKQDEELVAFCIPKRDVSRSELTATCADFLPQFMIPTRWIFVKEFPLNSNGKVDRNALLGSQLPTRPQEALKRMPTNLAEEMLWNIWKETLCDADFGTHDDFFEVGGNSLLSTKIISAMNASGWNIRFDQFVEMATIANLASLKTQSGPREFKATQLKEFEATPAQKRIIIDADVKLKQNRKPYINSMSFVWPDLCLKKASAALNLCIQSFSSLRTKFSWHDGVLFQKILDVSHIEVHDSHLIIQDFFMFGEKSTPNICAYYENSILTFVYDHAVFDGLSKAPFLKSFQRFYHGNFSLHPELTTIDFAYLEKQKLQEDSARQAMRWWENHLQVSQNCTTKILADRSFTLAEGTQGVYKINCDCNRIKHTLRKWRISFHALVLFCFNTLLAESCCSCETLTSTVAGNRHIRGFENAVGNFINVFPVKLTKNSQRNIAKNITAFAASLNTALSNSWIPIDMLKLPEKIYTLVMAHEGPYHGALDDLGLRPHNADESNLDFVNDFNLQVTLNGQSASLIAYYDQAIFDASSVSSYLNCLGKIIQLLADELNWDKHFNQLILDPIPHIIIQGSNYMRLDKNLVLGPTDRIARPCALDFSLSELEKIVGRCKFSNRKLVCVTRNKSSDLLRVIQNFTRMNDEQIDLHVTDEDEDNYMDDLELISEINAVCEKKLPKYMIPSAWAVVDKFKLTPNGKIDRKDLQNFSFKKSTTHIKPRTELEQQIWQIWSEVLGHNEFGIHDDFFGVGGNSLFTMTMLPKIQRLIDSKQSAVKIFASTQTIAGFVKALQSSAEHNMPILKPTGLQIFKASHAQKRIWLDGNVRLQASGYNMATMLCFKNSIKHHNLTKALERLVSDHQILRTKIQVGHDGTLNQIVIPVENIDINIPLAAVTCQAELIEKFFDHANQEFEIQISSVSRHEPLVKLAVIQNSQETIIAAAMHHVAFDGIGVNLFMEDLGRLYYDLAYTSPVLQYIDFAVYEHEWTGNKNFSNSLSWWTDRLQDLNSPFSFGDRKQVDRTPQTSSKTVRFSDLQVKKLCSTQRLTFNMAMYLALAVVQAKISGRSDICIGCLDANRFRPELQTMFGCFVNTLAQRTWMKKNFSESISDTRDLLLKSMAHSNVPFDMVLESLNLGIQPRGITPLFNVMLSTIDGDLFSDSSVQDTWQSTKASFEDANEFAASSKFDQNWYIETNADEIFATLVYDKNILDEETAESALARFKLCCEVIASTTRYEDFNLLLPSEIQMHRTLSNNVAEHRFEMKPIGQRLTESCYRNEDRTAVSHNGVKISYKQLFTKSASFASSLEVEKGDVVVVSMKKSIEMVIVMVALQLAGAVYFPIHPDEPQERQAELAKQAGAKLIITTLENKKEFSKPLSTEDDVEKPCYFVSTSGSTGVPKIVVISHRALSSFTDCLCLQPFNWSPADVILQTVRCSFDPHIMQIYSSLIIGCGVAIIDDEDVVSSKKLSESICREAATVLTLVPAMMRQLMGEQRFAVPPIRQLISGGEQLDEDIAFWIKEELKIPQLLNVYGPAEATIITTVAEISDPRVVAIGVPIANSACSILDEFGQPVSRNTPGELFISGLGLMSGYLGSATDMRMYASGDVVKINDKGNLIYIGRKDNQIKINGQRVHLAEVQQVITNHPAVKQCFIKMHNRELAAYIMGDVSLEIIFEFCCKKLSRHMVPTLWCTLTTVVLTRNGKVNYNELPEPRRLNTNKIILPQNALQKSLWQAVSLHVGKDDFGIFHSLVYDLGLSSLTIMTLLPKLQNFVPRLEYKDIIRCDTISSLAENFCASGPIENKEENKLNWPVVCDVEGPAYYVQKQYFNSFASGQNNNVTLNITIKNCDTKILENTYNCILDSCSTFRTFFFKKPEGLQQVVVPRSKCFTRFVVTSRHEIFINEQTCSFDLRHKPNKKHWPLLRFCVADCELQIVSHHIALDTIGLVLLEKKILETYTGLLHAKEFFCEKEKHTPLEFGYFESMLPDASTYWKRINEKLAHQTSWMPNASHRSGTEPAEEAMYFVKQVDIETSKLKHLAKLKSTTLFTICLFAFDRAMRLIADKPENNIPIAFLFHNRWRPETQEMIACMVQTSMFLTQADLTLEKLDEHVNETYENSKQAPWPWLTKDFDINLLFSSEDGFDYQALSTMPDEHALTKTNRFLCCSVSGLNSDQIWLKLKYDTGIFCQTQALKIFNIIQDELRKLEKKI